MTQSRLKPALSTVEQFRAEAVKPLFAVAGATQMAVDLARGYAGEAQQSAQQRLDAVQARVAQVERDPRALQSHAREAFNARVEELAKEARQAQARFEARLAELQKDARQLPVRVQAQLSEALDELVATYADLTGRGERFVAALRKDGVRAVTATPAAPRRRTAKPASTGTRSSAGTKAPATKAAAKKAPATKKAAKKTAAKKTAAKKAAAPKAD